MSAAFTPGPWEASLEAARFIIQHTPDHGIGKRALACTAGAEPDNPFNAYLIAAAPDLYEALEYAERIFTAAYHTTRLESGARAKMLAALAKARGETL